MSHARVMAPSHEQKAAPSLRHASLRAEDDSHGSTAEALTVTPACDRVYVYRVPASSESTTTDLLRALQDIVRSTTQRAAEDPSDMPPRADT